MDPRPTVDGLRAAAHRVPLPEPEADGTLAWSATTVVTVVAAAGGEQGLGWTYGPAAIRDVVGEVLAPAVRGLDPHDIGRAHLRMRRAGRNAPTPGLVSYAISAVDVALWDLKAKLLGIPLTTLFGRCRDTVPLYGSGGFTSMSDDQLCDQLTGWVRDDGMTAVKIKVAQDGGDDIARDLQRIAIARDTVDGAAELMIDANGGYDTKPALRVAAEAARLGVTWFEEPVSSDRPADLALLRAAVLPEITAGEYGTTVEYFRRMCEAGAVDCLQVDATRCGGYTGLFAAAAVADSHGLRVSTHCGPHLHAPACAALPNLRHAEWFADHVYADSVLFAGLDTVHQGTLRPQCDRPGHGMRLRA
ncbi:enolase C-terminal domain-like protein [Krasilnikovia sp. MM14-A1004]